MIAFPFGLSCLIIVAGAAVALYSWPHPTDWLGVFLGFVVSGSGGLLMAAVIAGT